MRLLLDTHTIIWWWTNDTRLNAHRRATIDAEECSVSAISIWEMVAKHRLGKLREVDAILPRLWELLELDAFERIMLSFEHAERGASYPVAHADPFDRLLAAQAELEGLTLMTRDGAFAAFPCATRW